MRPAKCPADPADDPRRERLTVSAHTRALDATTALTDDLTVDLVWMVRPRRYLWVAVTAGVLVGAAGGWWAGALIERGQWFFTASGVIVLGGLGTNIGVDFFLLALGSSRLYLVDSSRVTARPVRRATPLRRDSIAWHGGRLFPRVIIDGRTHVTGRKYRDRLRRMLGDERSRGPDATRTHETQASDVQEG